VLPLLTVQVLAAIGLIATFISLVLGRPAAHSSVGPVRVVARRESPGVAHVAWIVGTVVVVLWPVGALLAPAYAYHWPAFPDFPYSWVVQLLGVVLGVGGGVLFFRAAAALGRFMTPAIQVQQGHELIQEGPYRYVRHPVYTAILTLAIGQALFFLSLPIALVMLLLAGLANYRARLEEELLRSPEGFGTRYDAYVAKTGRFLPRLRSGR
jgi:protein-S-isoprenylcysteine O-methyltransferase Ste14